MDNKMIENAIDNGYRLGARHVIEHIEARMYYCPDAWKTGPNSIIFNIVQNALEDCRRIYAERGGDNAED